MGGVNLIDVSGACAASAGLTALVSTRASALGRFVGVMDRPDGVRKLHETETPLVGGLALLVPSFSVALLYGLIGTQGSFVQLAVIASAVMVLIGVIDDRLGISPVWRLAAMVFIVFSVFSLEPLFVLHSLKFLLLHQAQFAFGLGVFAAPATALFILGFVNAVNMADGMNGQFLGSMVVWCLLIAHHLGAADAVPFLIVACSAVVTFAFNLRGRLFAGSSGAYAGALFVALGAIAAYRIDNGAMPAQLPLLWFWLPVVDCVRLMVSRSWARKSPLAGDRNHFHHKLLRSMRVREALPLYLFLLAAPGAVGEWHAHWGAAVGVICFAVYAGILLRPERAAEIGLGGEARVKVLPRAFPASPRPYWRAPLATADTEMAAAKVLEQQKSG